MKDITTKKSISGVIYNFIIQNRVFHSIMNEHNEDNCLLWDTFSKISFHLPHFFNVKNYISDSVWNHEIEYRKKYKIVSDVNMRQFLLCK